MIEMDNATLGPNEEGNHITAQVKSNFLTTSTTSQNSAPRENLSYKNPYRCRMRAD